VLFGFCLTPQDTGRSATYPWVLWVWDIDRAVWAGDWKLSADFALVAAIPSSTPQGPSADPITLAVDHAAATTSSVAISWSNNGDTLSSTEIWVRDVTGGGGSVLWQTAIPGDVAETVTALDHSREYAVKVRHSRGGIAGNFTAEVTCYTALEAPTLIALGHGSQKVQLDIANFAGGATLRVERSPIGAGTWSTIATYSNEPVGTRTDYDTTTVCRDEYDYRAYVFDTARPVAVRESAYSATDDVEACRDEIL
jgi:hypothetical protein